MKNPVVTLKLNQIQLRREQVDQEDYPECNKQTWRKICEIEVRY